MFQVELFGERLKELMFERKKSQKDLAEKLKCSVSTISRYLNGKRTPRTETLISLCDYFSCSADFLLGRTEEIGKIFAVAPTFSQRIGVVLSYFNISKYRLAKDTQIGEADLYEWQSGKSQPSVDSLCRLADYLDCSVDFILGREM